MKQDLMKKTKCNKRNKTRPEPTKCPLVYKNNFAGTKML